MNQNFIPLALELKRERRNEIAAFAAKGRARTTPYFYIGTIR